ncbi:MAG: hypothetical protein U1E15_05030 [Hyphomicrobiales bacterium]
MRLVYLPEARRDAAWWRLYYRRTFPQGRGGAYRHLLTVEKNLRENPLLGVELENLPLRRLTIPNTPFALIYRVKMDTIEILRLYDMRQQGSTGFQED